MKIKIGEKVYLQKYEVAHILHNLNSAPGVVLQEIFKDGKNGSFFFVSGPDDALRFDCVFQDPASIEWLMKQDWIVDYNEYADTPIAELEAFVECLRAEHNVDIDEFNAKDEAYRREHFAEKGSEFHKSDYIISSLEGLIDARKGKAVFVFPDEYQGDTPSILQKKLNFFARLFSRGAQ